MRAATVVPGNPASAGVADRPAPPASVPQALTVEGQPDDVKVVVDLQA